MHGDWIRIQGLRSQHNNQRNLHALTPNQMMETFLVLPHAKEDPDVLVLIWTATGEKACSGAALRGDRTMYVPKPSAALT